MKRTAEIVLSLIGALVFGFFAFVGGLLVALQDNQQFRDLLETTVAQEPEIGAGNIETYAKIMATGGWALIILSTLAIILGIVSIIMLKGNKKPKAAGITLIITAVIISILYLGVGLIGGAFYLIAGIMCLVRKPKATDIESGNL